MVGKVSIGRSFGGCLKYLFEGRKNEEKPDKHAKVLAANGVRSYNVEKMTADFNRRRVQNADLGRAVWHTALAFHVDDRSKLTDEKLVEIAKAYMEQMKMDPQQSQWVLIKHGDTRHPHMHLVVNRVLPGGETISDQFCNMRSIEASEKVSVNYGLTVAKQKKKDLSLTHVKAMPGHQQARYGIYKAILDTFPKSESFGELLDNLKEAGISSKVQQNKEGKPTGLTFEFEGHHFKASQIDRECSTANLLRVFAEKQQKRQSAVGRLRAGLSKALAEKEKEKQEAAKKQKNTPIQEKKEAIKPQEPEKPIQKPRIRLKH